MKFSRFGLVVALVVGAVGIQALPAHAATTRTFVGAAGGRWSVAANWSPAGVPQNGDAIVLTDAVDGSKNDVDSLTIASLTFQASNPQRNYQVIQSSNTPLRITGDISADANLGYATTSAVPTANFIELVSGQHRVHAAAGTRIGIDHLTGAGGITADGPGVVTWGSSNYTGPTNVDQGTLTFNSTIALGAKSAGTTVASGATLEMNLNATDTLLEPLTLHGDGIAPANEGALRILNGTVGGPVVLSGATTVVATLGTLKGHVTGDGPLRIAGAIEGTNDHTAGTELVGSTRPAGARPFGTGPVTIPGGGGLALDGDTITNPVVVLDAPTWPYAITCSGGDSTLTGGVTFATNGSNPANARLIDVVSGSLEIQGGLHGSGNVRTLGSPLVFSGAAPSTATGTIAVSGDLFSDGAGVPKLPSVTLAESTSVTTVADDQFLAGASVAGSGVLDLQGTRQALHRLDSTGALLLGVTDGTTPDASTFTVDELALHGAVQFLVAGTSVGTNVDRIAVTGQVDVTNADLFIEPDGDVPVGTTVTLVANAGNDAVVGAFAELPEGTTFADSGRVYRITYRGGDGNDVALTRVTGFPPRPSGYWMLGAGGAVYSFGDAPWLGGSAPGAGGAVDIEPTPSGRGYWLLDASGVVTARGDAPVLGNAALPGWSSGERATALSSTPDGDGYWIFTNRGRVLEFGAAEWFGDLADIRLNGPILDSIPTPSGGGYYMVGSDGGIFAFGDAQFHGSMGGYRLNAPVQSLVPDPDGSGYWLVASDGGVFAFGAGFRGSLGGIHLNRPVTGMVPFGNGYLMVGEDGGLFNFSDKPFLGSLGGVALPAPIVSVAALS